LLPLSFRTRTNAVFAIALVTLAILGAISHRETARLAQEEKWVSHTREVLEASAVMSSHLSQASAARRGYLLFGTAHEQQRFGDASSETLADLERLRALTSDNAGQQDGLRALEPLIQSRLAILKQSIDLHQSSANRDDEAQAALSKQGTELGEQIAELQQGFHDAESIFLRQRLADAEATARLTFRIESALALFVCAVLIAALIFLNREISLRERAERASIEKERLLRSVLDSSSDAILVSDSKGNVILRNAEAARYHMKVPSDVPLERWAQEFGVFQRDKETHVPSAELPLARAAINGESVDNMEVYIKPPGWENGRWHLASSRPLVDSAGRRQGGIVVLRDVTERKYLEEDRDRLIVELYRSLGNVKTLTGLLPICAGCKKIRDDKGYWTQVEDYISQHPEVTFSHGLCPECVNGLYPELMNKKGKH